ncbi:MULTISPECIES: zinc-binding dehydrogenase [unclassified Nocardioides]|uniref:zinc-binding dehydrogenase n=1 Tax=unclassified Nocardioides TaxID=2615069 RepID=UPI000702D564|nr:MULTISPECIES: zinc-binding dehydrogenase [unclassified Nocardioides]KQZ76054.1 hypothetical protein ASD66_07140 [Nocardioides sp. Root151]KRF15127.1 hypothetical protein ASH02_12910 [Nocardioides sp. Soil796]
MRAIRLHDFGPADNLRLDELPDLTPGDGQIRIAVEAAGVHLLDTTLRAGDPAGPMPLPDLPTVPGREVAGVVDRVGPGVSESWRGARVVAHLGMVPGGYADQAVTSVDNPNLFRVRDGVDLSDAVAMVGTGRTAQGILEIEPPMVGDVVLVPSAAGGLGWLLAQAARRGGARVVALAGGKEKVDRLAALRPDLVVDYRESGWHKRVADGPGPISLVYDGVGGEVGRHALELLRPGGRMVMFGWSSGTATDFTSADLVQRGLSVSWSLGPRMAALPGGIPGLAGRALNRLAAGDWKPLVSTYPLADAARAHSDLEQRRALGKVVLLPRQ